MDSERLRRLPHLSSYLVPAHDRVTQLWESKILQQWIEHYEGPLELDLRLLYEGKLAT
jgi:hypothetical protein